MDALLDSFSEPEKTAYLAAIAGLASADRQASAEEAEFLQTLAQAANLSPEATRQVLASAQDASNLSIAQHLDVLKGSDLKYSLVADIISFAKADGKYSPEEEQMLQKMAAYLGVSTEQVGALGQAVEQAAQQPVATTPEALTNNLSGGGLGDMLRRVGIPSGALAKGLIGILAPILISRVLSGRGGGGGMMGGMGGGGMGGGLLGALGGLLGGGLLGGMMGGGQQGGGGLLGGMMGGGRTSTGPNLGGGLGSLMGVLGGLGGRSSYGGLGGGGLGSVLGGLFGGR